MIERSDGILLPEAEQRVLGQIIDKIGTEKPDLAEAIRLCAIPHWFNKEILAWLRREGSKPSQRTESILKELKLKKLALTDSANLSLHDNVRNLLLRRWREDAEDFQALNAKAAAYYEYKLQQSAISEPDKCAEWEREEMYHLLVSDKQRGIDRFKGLCNEAVDSYRLSTLDLLLNIANEQIDDPSPGIQHWIQFFEGKKHQLSSDWEKALEVWERLKEERASFTEDLELSLAVHLSILYKDRGDWKNAIECLESSLKTLEKNGHEQSMITILNNQGYLYKDKGEWEKAENDFQRGAEISRKIGDKRGMAVSLKSLGILYKDKKRWDEALVQFGTSLETLETIGDDHCLARTYEDRGLLFKDRGLLQKDREDFQKADRDFQRAREIVDRIGDEREQAAAFNSLALLYKDRGLLYKDAEDLQRAETNFAHARDLLEKTGDQRRIADIFNYLGFLYAAAMAWLRPTENFQRALKNFQEALTRLTKIGDERGTAVILNNLGLLYRRKGEPKPAIDYFQQSLEIVKRVGDEMNAATTMYELALLYEDTGKYDKAIDLLENVLKISEGPGHPDSRIKKSRQKLEMIKAKAMASESASDQ